MKAWELVDADEVTSTVSVEEATDLGEVMMAPGPEGRGTLGTEEGEAGSDDESMPPLEPVAGAAAPEPEALKQKAATAKAAEAKKKAWKGTFEEEEASSTFASENLVDKGGLLLLSSMTVYDLVKVAVVGFFLLDGPVWAAVSSGRKATHSADLHKASEQAEAWRSKAFEWRTEADKWERAARLTEFKTLEVMAEAREEVEAYKHALTMCDLQVNKVNQSGLRPSASTTTTRTDPSPPPVLRLSSPVVDIAKTAAHHVVEGVADAADVAVRALESALGATVEKGVCVKRSLFDGAHMCAQPGGGWKNKHHSGDKKKVKADKKKNKGRGGRRAAQLLDDEAQADDLSSSSSSSEEESWNGHLIVEPSTSLSVALTGATTSITSSSSAKTTPTVNLGTGFGLISGWAPGTAGAASSYSSSEKKTPLVLEGADLVSKGRWNRVQTGGAPLTSPTHKLLGGTRGTLAASHPQKIRVLYAVFGSGCDGYEPAHDAEMAATELLARYCDAEQTCELEVTNAQLGGDPFKNCKKGLDVVYACDSENGNPEDIRFTKHHREAFGTRFVKLDCDN